MDNASVLSRRDVRLVMKAAREQVLLGPKLGTGYPVADRRPGLLGDLELDRPARFLLDYGSTVPYLSPDTYVLHPEPHEVATAQLAVDREVEQCQVPARVFKLEPDSFGLSGCFWPMRRPLFQGSLANTTKDGIVVRMVRSLIPTAPPQRSSSPEPQRNNRSAAALVKESRRPIPVVVAAEPDPLLRCEQAEREKKKPITYTRSLNW
jgi:hypothetical protein